jgi:hypothetical protein
MKTEIIEGTFADVQRQLSALPYAPDQPLRVVITGLAATETPEEKPFHPTEFRNGVPLLPRRELTEPITLELVKRLLDEADEEILDAYRTSGH